jgi:carbamoyltransferase
VDVTYHFGTSAYRIFTGSRANLHIFLTHLYLILSYILGISAYFHDSAACLIQDGQILAACQEERFSRIKHDPGFPIQSINFALNEAKITINDCEAIVFFEKPFIKFERILETALSATPLGFEVFRKAIPMWVKDKLFMKNRMLKLLKKEFGLVDSQKLKFSQHHLSHAASAYYPSGFDNAAILVADGVGEWSTSSIWHGEKTKITAIEELQYPHSLGLLYSAFTRYVGFKINSGEYKLMGLAPYGNPLYAEKIKTELIDIQEDGSFSLNMKYFGFSHSLDTINKEFTNLFGQEARADNTEITQFYKDIARSIQLVAEDLMISLARRAINLTGSTNLCLAGGVALNCVANQKIQEAFPNINIWIQPAAGDAGTAMGAALAYFYAKNPEAMMTKDFHPFLGPTYSSQDIQNQLETEKAVFHPLESTEMDETSAQLLDKQKVVGWFQGAAEFGPRALGSRSILADPRPAEMQKTLNLKIKMREGFRPFAPAVLEEYRQDFFEGSHANPYMLFTEKTRVSHLPSITHVDGTARVQTVSKEDNPRFYSVLKAFYNKTQCPVLINTSFNVRGEPPVLSPKDAYTCFMSCQMDVLAIGNYILYKEEQAEQNKIMPNFEMD